MALLGATRRLHSHAVSAGSAAVRDDLPACSCVVSAGALLLQLHGSRGSAARNVMAHGSTSTPLAAQRLAWLNVTQRVAARRLLQLTAQRLALVVSRLSVSRLCSSASRDSTAFLATASRSASHRQLDGHARSASHSSTVRGYTARWLTAGSLLKALRSAATRSRSSIPRRHSTGSASQCITD